MHTNHVERVVGNEPRCLRSQPLPVEPRTLQRNPERARLVRHVQFVKHDLSGPLPGGPLDNRQVQAVVVLGSGRVPVFQAFEGKELGVGMGSGQPDCLGISGEHRCGVGHLNGSQQNEFAG